MAQSIGAVRADNVARFKSEVMRARCDYRWMPDGNLEAILTLTLPAGNEMRFTAQCDPKPILAYVLANQRGEISGFSLKKLWKGVKKVAKGVVTSKVFKVASTALAFAAPVLGPLAPVALAGSAAMKAGRALISAKALVSAGNKTDAAKLVNYAAGIAKTPAVLSASASMASKATGGAPSSSKPLLRFAPSAPKPAAKPVNLGAYYSSSAPESSFAPKPAPKPAKPPLLKFAASKPAAKPSKPAATQARAVLKPATSSSNVVRLGSPESKIYALLLKPA
jgi:hypothetical protein